MWIIKNEKNKYGQYGAVQTWGNPSLPEGYVIFPEECWDVFYPNNKKMSGFVTFDVVNGIVANIEWNEEAYQAYIESLPEPTPEPEPMTQAEIEEMLLDQEYRLLLLEYGLEEEEPI